MKISEEIFHFSFPLNAAYLEIIYLSWALNLLFTMLQFGKKNISKKIIIKMRMSRCSGVQVRFGLICSSF